MVILHKHLITYEVELLVVLMFEEDLQQQLHGSRRGLVFVYGDKPSLLAYHGFYWEQTLC